MQHLVGVYFVIFKWCSHTAWDFWANINCEDSIATKHYLYVSIQWIENVYTPLWKIFRCLKEACRFSFRIDWCLEMFIIASILIRAPVETQSQLEHWSQLKTSSSIVWCCHHRASTKACFFVWKAVLVSIQTSLIRIMPKHFYFGLIRPYYM